MTFVTFLDIWKRLLAVFPSVRRHGRPFGQVPSLGRYGFQIGWKKKNMPSCCVRLLWTNCAATSMDFLAKGRKEWGGFEVANQTGLIKSPDIIKTPERFPIFFRPKPLPRSPESFLERGGAVWASGIFIRSE